MENSVVCSCCYKPLPSALEQYGEYDWPICFSCLTLGVDNWHDGITERANGDRVLYLNGGCIEFLRPFEWKLPVFHQKEAIDIKRYDMPLLTKRRARARKRV